MNKKQLIVSWVMGIIIVLVVVILVGGCATTPTQPIPTQEELAKLDYGTPISIDYEKAIKQYFENRLFDPYSAVYEFDTLSQKYWYRDSKMMGGKTYIGYAVFVKVNAKNRMGGYVGKKKYAFIFRDNSIIRVITPREFKLMEYFAR